MSIEPTLRRNRPAAAVFRCTAVLFAAAAAWAQLAEVPYMTGRITDNAEILSPASRTRITGLLKAHEDGGSGELVVLTVSSLEGGRLEEFASRVFTAWNLGDKDRQNGVLLLVVPADRRARIEVGNGLRDRLSDVAAGRIIRDIVAPQFQRGGFGDGVEAGVQAIIGQLDGTPASATEPQETVSGNAESILEGPDLSIPERILLGSFIFGIIGLFTIIGVVTPGAGWFLYLFLIPFWAMFPMIVVGVRGALVLLVTYIVCFPIAKIVLSRIRWYRQARAELKAKGRAQIGGFTLRGGASSAVPWSSK